MVTKCNKEESKHLLRGALLGCGHIAPFHLHAWDNIEGVEIVALANRTISKAEALALEFGIDLDHIYNDYSELLKNEVLDFVDIATAPYIHRQQVEAAAAHGRHVLCQKPFAPTLNDAQAMISACKSVGVLLSINENWRWRSWYREVKHLLDQGVVGQPRYARIEYHNGLTLPNLDGIPPRVFLNQSYLADMEKLIVYEWGIHLIDISRFFFGEVDSVFARLNKVNPNCRGEERALLILDIGGVSCLIDISWATVEVENRFRRFERMTIEGDEGTIELLPDQGYILQVMTKRGVKSNPALNGTLEEAYQNSFTAAQSHFIECLREEKIPETVAEDNIKTLAVALAAYESASQNQVIMMEKYHAC